MAACSTSQKRKWGHSPFRLILHKCGGYQGHAIPAVLYRGRMPRTARTIVGGCCYHLINRGNDQARIFHERADYAAFLSLIKKTQGGGGGGGGGGGKHLITVIRYVERNALRAGLVARAEHWH